MQPADYLREGGWPVYSMMTLNLLLFPGSLVFLVVALIRRKTELLFAAILLGGAILVLGFGAFAHLQAREMVEAALSVGDPSELETMRNKGNAEARLPLIVGVMVALSPLVVGSFLGPVGLMRGSKSVVWIAPIAIACGVALLGVGFVVYQMSLGMTETARAVADPSEVAMLVASAENTVRVGLWLMLGGIVPLLFGTVLTIKSRGV